MASPIHVLLARDLAGLGHIGDVVRVRPGYARNFLFPRKIALPVLPKRVQQLEHQKQLVRHRKRQLITESEQHKTKLEQLQLDITAKAGKNGKLFGSVGTRDIEAALRAQGYATDHRDIKLQQPIKTVGLHTAAARLEGGVTATLRVMVVAQAGAQEQQEDQNEKQTLQENQQQTSAQEGNPEQQESPDDLEDMELDDLGDEEEDEDRQASSSD
ncbi:MAG: 50S ribosomal protein L9 [Myxococcota bacterium]